MSKPATRPNPQASDAAETARMVLSVAEVAKLLGVSPRTLERLRRDGGGPRFVRMGRRLGYPKADLLAWLDATAATSNGAPAGTAAFKQERR